MHFQLLGAAGKVSVSKLHVVLLVCDLAEQVDAMELVENFEAYSVAFHACLGVHGLQVVFWHADDFTLGISYDLVAN